MSHHIFTSDCADHDVVRPDAPLSVPFAISYTASNVAAYTDEDNADTVNSFIPAKSWSRGVVKTPPGWSIRNSRGSCSCREVVRFAPCFRCQNFSHKKARHQARSSLLLPTKVQLIIS